MLTSSNELKFVLIFFASLLIALRTTSQVRKIAIKHGIGETPNARKIHKTFMPHLGGLGIFAGFAFGVIASGAFFPDLMKEIFRAYWGLIAAAVVILLLGIYDDLKGLDAKRKFLGQFLAVSLIVVSGCVIREVRLPFGGYLQLGFWALPVTYLWLIGVNNAVNLLDGLDGLAAGVSLIVSAVLAVISFQTGNWPLFILILSLIGGILGFLKYNYHPASIFMGDTGSLFLGLMMAALSLKTVETAPGRFGLLLPIIILAIPIGDTSVAVFRRLNKGKHPFKPDKDHLHHRLIYLGLTHKQAVHIIYLISLLYAVAAFLIYKQTGLFGEILLLVVVILSAFGLKRIGYLEARKTTTLYGDKSVIKVKRELAPLSMSRMMHKLILAIMDMVTVNLALIGTWWLRFESGLLHPVHHIKMDQFLMTPVVVLLTLGWLLLFVLNDLYKVRWDVSRFDQIRQNSKVIIFGVFILFVITFNPQDVFTEGKLTLLLYGLMLILFVNTGRLLIIYFEKKFKVLEYAPHKTLLVGDTEKAKKLLKVINKNPHLLYEPVGYVTKEKKDKPFYGLPWLGSYNDLSSIIRRYGVEEVIIAINERSRDEILNIVARAMHMTVVFKILPQIYDVVSGHKTAEVIGHPLIRLFPESMKLWQWVFKRSMDMLNALFWLILLSPFAVIIIAVQLSSGIRPPFVIVESVGKNGQPFGMFNFRTTSVDGRQPWIGRLLERTRIYKLPAIVNILMGKMSFVGPRPDDTETARRFEGKIKFYNRRFMVRPGLTGWAQVKYRYETEALKYRRDQLKLDLFYLENMSLSFDLRILLRTVAIFLLGR